MEQITQTESLTLPPSETPTVLRAVEVVTTQAMTVTDVDQATPSSSREDEEHSILETPLILEAR